MGAIGYARVSTVGQSLETQLAQLKGHGCERILKEKISGSTSNRPELHRLLSNLEPGDTLVVTRLDRLARSTSDLLQILWTINRKGGFFFSIAEPWANTQSPLGKLMLTILGGIAEFERDLTAIRTAEGRARAKEAGVKSGPKPKLSFHQVEEIKRRRATGESCRFLARSYKVSTNTISRIKPVEPVGLRRFGQLIPNTSGFLNRKPPNGAVAIRHVESRSWAANLGDWLPAHGGVRLEALTALSFRACNSFFMASSLALDRTCCSLRPDKADPISISFLAITLLFVSRLTAARWSHASNAHAPSNAVFIVRRRVTVRSNSPHRAASLVCLMSITPAVRGIAASFGA